MTCFDKLGEFEDLIIDGVAVKIGTTIVWFEASPLPREKINCP